MSRAGKADDRLHLDAYYTPDTLAEALVGVLPIGAGTLALEPHAGGGAFVRALKKRGAFVQALDVNPLAPGLHDAHGQYRCDFLRWCAPVKKRPEWVIGNPPFLNAVSHIERAMNVTDRHVVMLLRLGIMESAKRLEFWRSSGRHLRALWVLSQRPSFTGGGTDSAAYGWFWWDLEHDGPTDIDWLSWR
ncbi:MAG: hypothetical protein ACPHCN_09340 [Mycobacterium sp.]